MLQYKKFIVVIWLLICSNTVFSQADTANNERAYRTSVASMWRMDAHAGFSELADSVTIDSIVVNKGMREMLAYSNKKLLKVYRIHLGAQPIGPKQFLGDFKTPEGSYYICYKNALSLYHKSLGISYPNTTDEQNARKAGKSPGGNIVIHGWPNGQENAGRHRYKNDWTNGCIAVTNSEIDEIFNHASVGIPIVINP
jgi:murein L,D-transpeptidase YafK